MNYKELCMHYKQYVFSFSLKGLNEILRCFQEANSKSNELAYFFIAKLLYFFANETNKYQLLCGDDTSNENFWTEKIEITLELTSHLIIQNILIKELSTHHKLPDDGVNLYYYKLTTI